MQHPSSPKQHHRRHTRWKPPEQGMFKINYDRAIFSENGTAGLGVIIRNHEGQVIASMSRLIPQPATIIQVEALAARSALQFAQENGISAAVFEGDSEVLTREINVDLPSLALHGHIFKDIKSLASSFTAAKFIHVRREGNSVAHALARRAINSHPITICMADVPTDIQNVVQADLPFYD